ncbi:glutathione S-transferase family protein [Labrys okinawensis]|uniref:glutathione S-transferase family protein n=1 Tax=Labrys okinawensis TaxID=346911 RepID=UPI0039BC23D8
MALTLYAHPFSSNCQKVLIALYENATPFTFRMLEDAGSMAELEALWPLKRFPILTDGDRTVIETSCIVEYLQLYHPGPVPMLPDDPKAALEVRILDRVFDHYISHPQQRVVYDSLRPEAERDPRGVNEARNLLETTYGWLETTLAGRSWATGEAFSLADCGAAPFLFYADWTHEIGPQYPVLRAYRSRLLVRPSVKRAVDEARPYRHYFPLGAPDRD